MARSRKNYTISQKVVALSPSPSDLIVRFSAPDGGPPETFDFNRYAGNGDIRCAFVEAFYEHYLSAASQTRRTAFYTIKYFFDFLNFPQNAAITETKLISTETLHAFISWIDHHPGWTIGTKSGVWTPPKLLLRWMQIRRPAWVSDDLELPFNPFPNRNLHAKRREGLSKAEIKRVLNACRLEINESWNLFLYGQSAIASGECTSRVAPRNLDLACRATLIKALHDRFGPEVPSWSVLTRKGAGFTPLARAVRLAGGISSMSRYFHMTLEAVIPYMIAIGSQLFANPDALRLIRRDCLSEHLFLDGRSIVSWEKPRSGRTQRRTFLRDKDMSPPSLIDRVLAMTEPLLDRCEPRHRDLLFIYGATERHRQVQPPPGYLILNKLAEFVQRHDLVDDEGAPLRLTLASLRTTGLSLAHAALGNDILKTQALANHASPETTRLYVDAPSARNARASEIGKLQARFVDAIRAGLFEAPPAPSHQSDVDASSATASGFTCSDPLNSPMPGQQKGRLCTAWLGCFTCPHAVIPLESQTLARLLQTQIALTNARRTVSPDRWNALYADKLAILERDIIPRFPADALEEARSIMAMLPPTVEVE
ncbi:site-specific integrase [Caulobacter sp.]|uniref:site-specific integrase n=1 Tax=Caulobacter sp. TaxID=78 RepID=UPI0016168EEC